MSDTGIVALVKALAPVADQETVDSAVETYLDNHPEATTTVQDGSITEAKLASALAQKVNQVSSLSDEIVLANGTLASLENTVQGKYTKPQTGIPASDLASNAIPDVSGFYTKPLDGVPKTDLSSDVQASLGKADTALQGSDVTEIVDDWLEENITNPNSPPLDRSLSSSSAAAPADIVGALSEISVKVSQQSFTEAEKAQARANIGAAKLDDVFSAGAKEALLACLAHVVWTTDDGQEYYDTLKDMLTIPPTLESISAVFAPGSNDIFDDTPLDSLKQYLTVTATYSGGDTAEVFLYNLSGELNVGTCTITVGYEGETTTFTVNVVEVPSSYTPLDFLTATGTQYIDLGLTWNSKYSSEAVIKGMVTSNSNTNWYYGSYGGNPARVYGLNNIAGTSLVFFRYGTGDDTTGHDFTPTAETTYTVGQQANVCVLDGTVHSSYTLMDYTIPVNIYIFARDNQGNADNKARCSISSFKLWDSDGELLANLAPYLDGSGTPCMYDSVRHLTLYNAGTGDFTYEEAS